eukprot:TRINITY_DN4038_c0_g1_i1.p1 TRINITY_DN4038_c0_g1~~TRINITY_DN4038_c0_g1_i1.p1  ORF type:complete len:297 (+),score=51.92 TRINITY_DN4038_c0_g1_i1:623-1513(+)
MVLSSRFLYVIDRDINKVRALDLSSHDWKIIPDLLFRNDKDTSHLLPLYDSNGFKLVVFGDLTLTTKNATSAALWDEQSQNWFSVLDSSIPAVDSVKIVTGAAVNPYDNRIILSVGASACNPLGLYYQSAIGSPPASGWQWTRVNSKTMDWSSTTGCKKLQAMSVINGALLVAWKSFTPDAVGFDLITRTTDAIPFEKEGTMTFIRPTNDAGSQQLLFLTSSGDSKGNKTVTIVIVIVVVLVAVAATVGGIVWYRKRASGGSFASLNTDDPAEYAPVAQPSDYRAPANVPPPEEQY